MLCRVVPVPLTGLRNWLVQFVLCRFDVRLLFRQRAAISTRAGSPAPAAALWPSLVAIGVGVGLPTLALFCALQHEFRPVTLQFGGAGGQAAEVVCHRGELVTGARVFTRAGMVAGIAVLCDAKAGTSTAQSRERGLIGSAEGTPVALHCPAGWVAVGIWGASGALVDRFSLACAQQQQLLLGPVVYLETAGGAGGQGFRASCARTALHGLSARAGALVDSVGPICSDGDRDG